MYWFIFVAFILLPYKSEAALVPTNSLTDHFKKAWEKTKDEGAIEGFSSAVCAAYILTPHTSAIGAACFADKVFEPLAAFLKKNIKDRRIVRFIEKVEEARSHVRTRIDRFGKKTISFVKNIPKEVERLVRQDLKTTGQEIKTFFVGAAKDLCFTNAPCTVAKAFVKLPGQIKEGFEKLGDKLEEGGKKVGQKIKQGWNKFKGLFR